MILFLKILSPLYERVENVKHTPKKMNSYAGAKIKLIYLVIYFLIVFAMFFSSCFNNKDRQVIASYNEKELFISDIVDDIPFNTSDSAYFAEKYVNDWIRKQLMLSYAEMNLSSGLLSYQKQIDDYNGRLKTS